VAAGANKNSAEVRCIMIGIIKRQKIGLKFKEETSEMLHLEHS
jgi:hypothetical protein